MMKDLQETHVKMMMNVMDKELVQFMVGAKEHQDLLKIKITIMMSHKQEISVLTIPKIKIIPIEIIFVMETEIVQIMDGVKAHQDDREINQIIYFLKFLKY